jgi:hypothetical protein
MGLMSQHCYRDVGELRPEPGKLRLDYKLLKLTSQRTPLSNHIKSPSRQVRLNDLGKDRRGSSRSTLPDLDA